MRHHRKTNGISRYAAALTEGLLWAAPFVLLAAAMTMWLGRLPMTVMQIPALLGWGAAAFVSGRRAGLHGRHHGIRTGCICGGMLWLLRICGAVLLGEMLKPGMLWYLAWLLPVGALGGVIGVNTRIKR